jgi:hypothetical protein
MFSLFLDLVLRLAVMMQVWQATTLEETVACAKANMPPTH